MARTCLHSSSKSDEVEGLHASSEELEAHPYRTIFSEGLYFRTMVCRSTAHKDMRGRRPCYGKAVVDALLWRSRSSAKRRSRSLN